MKRNSHEVAMGGVFTALCFLLLFFTALVPFSTFALSGLAGALVAVVVVECGTPVGWMSYTSVSLLAIFTVPDHQAVLLFICLFGHYPMLKPCLDTLPLRMLRVLAKVFVFTFAVVGVLGVSLLFLGLPAVSAELQLAGVWGVAAFLLVACVLFLFYDKILEKYIILYVSVYRKKFCIGV